MECCFFAIAWSSYVTYRLLNRYRQECEAQNIKTHLLLSLPYS